MSYDDSLATDTDKVRAFIGDTSNNSATELLTDDHIEAVLSLYTPFASAVAFLASELAVRFAQQPGSVTLPSGLSVSWASRVATWMALAQLARSGQLVSGGAFSVVSPRADGYAIQSAADELAR
jgi:hypothetical protein